MEVEAKINIKCRLNDLEGIITAVKKIPKVKEAALFSVYPPT